MSERRERSLHFLSIIKERVPSVALRVLTYSQQLREDLQVAWSAGLYGRLNVVGSAGFVAAGTVIAGASIVIGVGRIPGMLTGGTALGLLGAAHLGWLRQEMAKERGNS